MKGRSFSSAHKPSPLNIPLASIRVHRKILSHKIPLKLEKER